MRRRSLRGSEAAARDDGRRTRALRGGGGGYGGARSGGRSGGRCCSDAGGARLRVVALWVGVRVVGVGSCSSGVGVDDRACGGCSGGYCGSGDGGGGRTVGDGHLLPLSAAGGDGDVGLRNDAGRGAELLGGHGGGDAGGGGRGCCGGGGGAAVGVGVATGPVVVPVVLVVRGGLGVLSGSGLGGAHRCRLGGGDRR